MGRGRAVKKGGFGVSTTEITEITEMGRGRTVGSPDWSSSRRGH